MCAQPKLHVTRLRRKVSDAIFEHLVLSKARFGPKPPEHVNTPLGCLNEYASENKNLFYKWLTPVVSCLTAHRVGWAEFLSW